MREHRVGRQCSSDLYFHVKWPRVFSAFESRNYRLFFFGQIVSLVGTWMSQTASLWLIYHLSSSPLLLGMVGFASQMPIFTQVLSMLHSFALATLTLTNHISPAWLVSLSLVQGAINGLDMPTRQA